MGATHHHSRNTKSLSLPPYMAIGKTMSWLGAEHKRHPLLGGSSSLRIGQAPWVGEDIDPSLHRRQIRPWHGCAPQTLPVHQYKLGTEASDPMHLLSKAGWRNARQLNGRHYEEVKTCRVRGRDFFDRIQRPDHSAPIGVFRQGHGAKPQAMGAGQHGRWRRTAIRQQRMQTKVGNHILYLRSSSETRARISVHFSLDSSVRTS